MRGAGAGWAQGLVGLACLVGAVPGAGAYDMVQQSINAEHTWSLSSRQLTLGPGETSNSVQLSLAITGRYQNPNEYVHCLSGCRDGVYVSTPYIELDKWKQGMAIRAPQSLRASGGGQSATFTVVGETRNGYTYIGDGGSRGTVGNIAYTDGVTFHYSPWIGWLTPGQGGDVTYLTHNERYSASLKVTAPANTPAGTYTYTGPLASFNLQYCGPSNNPDFTSGTHWIDRNDTLTITVLGQCRFANSALTLDYGSLRPREAQGSRKAGTTTLTCNTDVRSGTLRLVSTSGSNATAQDGTAVKVAPGMDAIVTVNGKNASAGIAVPGPSSVPVEIVSTLETYGQVPAPGVFQGSAVLSFAAD